MPRKTIPIAEHEAIVAALTAFINKPKHPRPFPTDALGGVKFRGWVLRVVDGDTLMVRLDMPLALPDEPTSIRLRGLWIEELDDDDAVKRSRAEQAKADLEAMCPMMTPVTVYTFKQTYYRFEGEVIIDAPGPLHGKNVGHLQLKRGLVKQLPIAE